MNKHSNTTEAVKDATDRILGTAEMSIYDKDPFKTISDMENPFCVIGDLLVVLDRLVETIENDDDARVIQRIVWTARSELKTAEKMRCKLFHLTHPHRAHFEAVGWPGGEPHNLEADLLQLGDDIAALSDRLDQIRGKIGEQSA